MHKTFKIIGFDADDTLWVNEPYYQETEKNFCELLTEYQSRETISEELLKTEKQNLSLYGYGAKGFTLSMIETALNISKQNIQNSLIQKIILLGKELIDQPIVLLKGVQDVLEQLSKNGNTLIVATKGDLLDQERKLSKSNLKQYFHHIEIMSDKKESNYRKLLTQLNVSPQDFLMIGNSMKSDILPVINIGAYAVHIPYHTTWEHENIENTGILNNYWKINRISDIHSVLNL